MSCRGCSTQEEVEAAAAIRRAQIETWRQEQLEYDRKAHGLLPEPTIDEVQENVEDTFWTEPTLVGTAQPEPDMYEVKEEKPTRKTTAKKTVAKD